MLHAAAVTDEQLGRLRDAARAASERAYCPYSRFHVGAALLGESGRVYAGCNVENASYGLTMCAERNAVFQAVASGERTFTAVAIYTPTPEPAVPCGACRQVLHEFAPEALVYCFAESGPPRRFGVAKLLPHAFRLEVEEADSLQGKE